MGILLILITVLCACFAGSVPEPVAASDDFHFELTVTSASEEAALFSLLITGTTLTEQGEEKPFRIQRDDLKTPFRLNLERGKYTAVIEVKEGAALSKVQGFKNGEKMGYTSSNQKISTMYFASDN